VIRLDEGAVERMRRCVRAGGEPCGPIVRSHPDLTNWLFLDTAQVEGDAPQAEVTGWWLDGAGRVLAADRRYCPRCTPTLLSAAVRELVGSLLEPRPGGTRTALVIRSTPPGATVAIDGRSVGVTAIEYAVRPGSHRLRVERDGYRVEERQVAVAEGATTTVDVALDREADASARPRSGRVRRAAGWVSLGAGAAMMAGGAALFVMDREAIEDGGRRAEHRDSAAWGVGVGAAGLGVAALGGWLLWTGREDGPARIAAAPVAGGGVWVQAKLSF
jgi:hypothetical protein